MAGMRIRITGDKAVQAALRRLGDRAPRALAGALVTSAERIMAASKELVPVDTGALRASGQVEPPVISASRVSVEFGYGNSAIDYAIYVHENLAAVHPVGQAKFLEQPFLEAMDRVPGWVAADLRGWLGG